MVEVYVLINQKCVGGGGVRLNHEPAVLNEYDVVTELYLACATQCLRANKPGVLKNQTI